jgi:pSer/pThr/pTyr-binding forkhead associated (FHA) protein
MVPEITFEVTAGTQCGKRYVFKRPASCVAGRAEDCSIRLSGAFEHCLVSRHHCLLDIDPPRIRVQDLGSRNGTFVNGRLIGHRTSRDPVEQEAEPPSAGCELKDGDELGLGPVVLRVGIKGAEIVPAKSPVGAAGGA